MAWRKAANDFMRSGKVISLIGGVLGTGSYVWYCDVSRYTRMEKIYKTGNILAPFKDNAYDVDFFPRPKQFEDLRRALEPTFHNQYYVVCGEVGVGKSRLVVELVQHMMNNNARQGRGAPIYVMATQGKSFPEALANAVNFYFDEHISFKSFLDYVMRVRSMPQRDESARLTRVLDAIETSSFRYVQNYGCPVVLVVDGVASLQPDVLEKLQEKAKLWADTNTVKMVLVGVDHETEEILHRNVSLWSRIAFPITIPDLTEEEAIEFLMNDDKSTSSHSHVMSREHAEDIVNQIGGRIQQLIAFKRDHAHGISCTTTLAHLREHEREKFLHVSQLPTTWKVVSDLRSAPEHAVLLSKLIKKTSRNDVESLVKNGIVRYERRPIGIIITFQSKLTEHIVDEMQQAYMKESDVLMPGNVNQNAHH